MTNPFHQHGSSGFGDSWPTSGVPGASSSSSSSGPQRRPSYASIASGTSGLSRPPRAGAFSHLLNPSPDDPGHASSSLYSTGLGQPSLHLYRPQHSSSYDLGSILTAGQGSGAGSGSGMDRNGGDAAAHPHRASATSRWPQFGSGLPLFSSAFNEMYMTREPLSFPDEHGSNSRNQNISSTGFLSPSYLRGTIYLQRLEEAHKTKLLVQREGHAAQSSGGPGHAHHGHSHHGASKLPPATHSGVALQLVEKPPEFEDDEGLSPLPSRWNKDSKTTGLDVLGDGYEVKYTGHKSASEREHEACAIRANHYMPARCGVYYFEVTILSRKREDTQIGIGFCGADVNLSRAPGWEPDSWGYHGDDGQTFASQNVGKTYGPRFGHGDIIGCLLNYRLGHALFTKNGHELGIAFRDIKDKLYPTVGLKRPGDHILANFGQTPFAFDIDGYMKKQQRMVFDNIEEADTSKLSPPLDETELIQQLVLQFLQHDGYVETARAFAEEIHAEKKALSLDKTAEIEGVNIRDDEDANNRQSIRRAILEGDIDRALKHTDAYYPHVLKENEQVYFRLRCRKFIEMIRKEAELNLLMEKRGATSKRYSNVEDDEEMTEADENSNWDEEMDTEDGLDGSMGVSKLSHEALLYGQELRSEFHADPRREVSKHLDGIFALIAYPNPLKVKEVAHLLDRTGRVAVAEELNSAILRSLGKSSRAALENLYAQTSVLLEDLRQDGGDGAFVTIESIIDDIPKSSLL